MTVLFIINAKIGTHFYYAGEIYTLGAGAETTAIAAGQAVTYPSASPVASLNTVTATLAASQNNYSPAGYVGGVTNRLVLTAASGSSTITGLVAGLDGSLLLISNPSSTDSIIFTHLDASSAAANQFSNMNGVSVIIPPLGAARCTYISSKWQFA